MSASIEFPLDLPEVRILKSDLSGREIVITVESTRGWAICPKCKKRIEEFHSFGRQLRLRHLPILGRPVMIEIRPKRFRCLHCEDHPTTTQKLDWYDERSPHTKAYDQWLLLSLIGSTVADVARKERLTYDWVEGALERLLASEVNWAVREVLPQARIVVDRFHVAKAYRDCADQLRKEVQRELKAELSETEYEGLKGTMWLFRRDPEELEKEEQERLELLFECAPDLKQAHQLREELTAIFETEQSKQVGQAAIEDWQKRVREKWVALF